MAASNGHSRRWAIVEDAQFKLDEDRLVGRFPRLTLVFAAVKEQFEAIPAHRAIELGWDRWLYLTRTALDVPATVIFYEIQPLERVVLLLAADLNDD